MNIGRIVIAAVLLLAGTKVFCQTKMIAHRSHSGSIGTFSAQGGDNFGILPPRIDTVIRISDTSAVEITDEGTDTVYQHPYWNNPEIRVDSLRKLFPRINFIGFEQPEHHVRRSSGSGRPADVAQVAAPAAGAPVAADPRAGVPMLLLLCSMGAPLLAYAIWKTERRRNG